MAWKEIEVRDWAHVVREFEKLESGSPAFIPRFYRGQADARWPVVDSFSRLVGSCKDPNDALEIEYQAQRHFVADAHSFLDSSQVPNSGSLIGWWSLMQHYRAPTRLVDWSSSPFVAL
jgi:FRG domain